MVALGHVVLSRREHVMMLEAFDKGLLATTLRYPYEVRDQAPYFEDISDLKLPADMKELAAHIVDSLTIQPCFEICSKRVGDGLAYIHERLACFIDRDPFAGCWVDLIVHVEGEHPAWLSSRAGWLTHNDDATAT
jgi:hypothetical protein